MNRLEAQYLSRIVLNLTMEKESLDWKIGSKWSKDIEAALGSRSKKEHDLFKCKSINVLYL